jgi:stearoyl-CoA desaturase (delta-9 desaturase)
MRSYDFNWGPGSFIIFYHLLLAIILPLYLVYYTPSWSLIAVTIVLFFATGMSITGGYHRLYAHKAYKINRMAETIVLFFATMAGQGSALRWAFEHRLHHAHVDTELDPYSIKKGFWYAHILWIFKKPQAINPKVIPDLLKNSFLTFQDRHFPLLMTITNLAIFVLVGWALNDYTGAFVFAVWVRLFALHHSTWFINSLAHTLGDKPFSQEISAVDNYLLSLVTFGEGYHNYHHTFANDYRNGIRWFHFDPTKWLIWTLNKLGLANSLKRIDPITIKKRMVIERKDLLLNRLRDAWEAQKAEFEPLVNELSEKIVAKFGTFAELKEKYRQFTEECCSQDILHNLQLEIKALQHSLQQDIRTWRGLSRQIMRLKTT